MNEFEKAIKNKCEKKLPKFKKENGHTEKKKKMWKLETIYQYVTIWKLFDDITMT